MWKYLEAAPFYIRHMLASCYIDESDCQVVLEIGGGKTSMEEQLWDIARFYVNVDPANNDCSLAEALKEIGDDAFGFVAMGIDWDIDTDGMGAYQSAAALADLVILEAAVGYTHGRQQMERLRNVLADRELLLKVRLEIENSAETYRVRQMIILRRRGVSWP